MASAGARTNVSEIPWDDLIAIIKSKECVPFIGAGTSLPVLPRAAVLAEELLAEDERITNRRCPLPDRSDLSRVCQYLAVTHQDSQWPKRRIVARFQSTGPPDLLDPSECHRVLAALRLPVYITTNYDPFMMQALETEGVAPRREIARWNNSLLEEVDSDFDTGYRPSLTSPVVFHIHGHTDMPRSMVASEDDYLDFLVNTAKELGRNPRDPSERTMLPLPIRRAIRHHRLLFVGYSLADINFRVILRARVGSLEPSERQVHMSIQYSGENPKELEDYLQEYFRWTLDLSVFWGSAEDFTREMRRQWNR
jgi:hypothetical protein